MVSSSPTTKRQTLTTAIIAVLAACVGSGITLTLHPTGGSESAEPLSGESDRLEFDKRMAEIDSEWEATKRKVEQESALAVRSKVAELAIRFDTEMAEMEEITTKLNRSVDAVAESLRVGPPDEIETGMSPEERRYLDPDSKEWKEQLDADWEATFGAEK